MALQTPSCLLCHSNSEQTDSKAQTWTYQSRQNLRGEHERVTIEEIAKRIAKIKGIPYAGECQLDSQLGHSYIVPDETLSSETAACLGIRSERGFFGGIVPHEFVATKAVTHSLCALSDSGKLIGSMRWSVAQ